MSFNIIFTLCFIFVPTVVIIIAIDIVVYGEIIDSLGNNRRHGRRRGGQMALMLAIRITSCWNQSCSYLDFHGHHNYDYHIPNSMFMHSGSKTSHVWYQVLCSNLLLSQYCTVVIYVWQQH